MSDPELEKIRQQRLAQLQAQHGVSCYWGYVEKIIILVAACYLFQLILLLICY